MAKPEDKLKQRVFLDPAQKAVLVVKVKQLFNAEPSTPKSDIFARVAKEAKISPSTLKKAVLQADEQVGSNGAPKLSIEITGLEAYIAWHVKNALRKGFGG